MIDKSKMASVVENIEESILSCSICYQSFNKPKALPCLHTFCEGCLRDYIASRFETQGSFPCPLCRQDIQIPTSGVIGFPDNHLIISLFDTLLVAQTKGTYPNHGDGQGAGRSEVVSTINNIAPSRMEILSSSIQVSRQDSEIFSSLDYEMVSVMKLLRRFGNHGKNLGEFIRISGISVYCVTEDIAVCDSGTNSITIVSPKGEFKTIFVCDCHIHDVAWTDEGNLLVSVSNANSALLHEYSKEGKLLAIHGSFYKYEHPSGLALNAKNEAIVSSLGNDCIHVLTGQRKPSVKFGKKGSGSNHFHMPYYVATNRSNDVIVSDTGNHRIKIHKRNGEYLGTIGSKGMEMGEFFYPMGISTDMFDNIYVADANNYRVQVFNSEGKFIACPLQKTYEYGMDIKPTHVTVTPSDKLLVVIQGARFAELHLYDWLLPQPIKKKTSVQ